MQQKEVPFNYFYRQWLEAYDRLLNNEMENILDNLNLENVCREMDNFELTFLTRDKISREQKIKSLESALWEVCMYYVALSNSSCPKESNDAVDFVNYILKNLTTNPYRDSFLFSLEFISQNILLELGKGYPILMQQNSEDEEKQCIVTLDTNNCLDQIETVNMTLEEQASTIFKICNMESRGLQGPMPNVLIRKREF